MPFNEVMSKFKSGNLHSGSKSGPPVKKRSQAIAIMLSEKKKADAGDAEYESENGAGAPHRSTRKHAASLAGLKRATRGK